MFTGIIEGFGKVIELKSDHENLNITLESKLTQELKIDQSPPVLTFGQIWSNFV